MTTLDELRKQMSAAQARKARAEVLQSQADADLAATRQKLKDEFGVTTPDEAREMLEILQRDLDEQVAKVEKALKESHA